METTIVFQDTLSEAQQASQSTHQPTLGLSSFPSPRPLIIRLYCIYLQNLICLSYFLQVLLAYVYL